MKIASTCLFAHDSVLLKQNKDKDCRFRTIVSDFPALSACITNNYSLNQIKICSFSKPKAINIFVFSIQCFIFIW